MVKLTNGGESVQMSCQRSMRPGLGVELDAATIDRESPVQSEGSCIEQGGSRCGWRVNADVVEMMQSGGLRR
jgi:hypothetical protein